MLLTRRNPAARAAPTPSVERVLQIGEGRFIRGFVDWLLQELHHAGLFDGSVVLSPARVQGRDKITQLAAQDYLFTVWTRGIEQGATVDRTTVVSIIARGVNPFEDWPAFLACAEQEPIDIIISNTTEMGIAYAPTPWPRGAAPASYPARLTAYLKRRYDHFSGAPWAGLLILPCELIDDNGATLREIVLRHATDWELGDEFTAWIEQCNVFCNTLVDRITPGLSPAEQQAASQRLGYEDRQLVVAEPYYIWAIEAHHRVMRRLPFAQTRLNVVYTDDLRRYRVQKLRVLNGAHSVMAALGLFLGLDTVRDAMTHPLLGPLVRRVVDEIIAPYSEIEAGALREYAVTIFERFLNPHIDHRLQDITLYSVGKFRIRLLPVLRRYYAAHGAAPRPLSLSLAAHVALFAPGSPWRIDDTPDVLDRMSAHWDRANGLRNAIQAILGDESLWGQDLTALRGLTADVSDYVNQIRAGSLDGALSALLPAMST